MNLPQLPQDKANHVVYGIAVYLAVAPVFGGLYAIGAVVAVAALKELIDWAGGKGTPELLDFLATVAGGLAGFGSSRL
jgi:hypothetical protein